MNLWASIFTVWVLFLLVASQYRSRTYSIFGSIALTLHLIVGILILPILPYGWDIEIFHEVAIEIADGGLPKRSTGVSSFSTLQALLYVIFDTDPKVVSVFNSLFAVLLPLPVSYIATKLYPSAVRSTQGLIVVLLFLPTPFLFMTLPMRDSFSIFVGFTILAAVVYANSTREMWPLVIAIPLWGALFLVRPELALIIGIGSTSVGVLAALNVIFKRQFSLQELLFAVTPVGAAGAVIGSRIFSFDRLRAESSWRTQGGGAYLEWMQFESITDMIIAAPTRAIFFQYAPFPLQPDTVFQALPLATLPFLILFTVGAYRSLTWCQIDTTVATLLITVYFAGILGYGIVTSNFGTGVRHRMMFTFTLAIFAAPVIERWERLVLDWIRVQQLNRLVLSTTQWLRIWPKN